MNKLRILPDTHDQRLSLAALWLAMAAWPALAANDYLLSIGSTLLINIILVASLDLLVGSTGIVSLAHGAFFGIGAYTSGILSTVAGCSPWLGTLAAVGAGIFAALLIGLPTLRLRGHAFAMATLGFNAIVTTVLTGWVSLTGGPNGLIGVPAYTLVSFPLDTPTRFYPIAWFASGLAMLALFNLARSRQGRSLRALASSDIAAAGSGIPVFRYKLAAFALACALAALAGALYVHQNNFASPDTFSFSTSVLLLVMVWVGGAGRRFGPVFGALVYTLLPELLHRFDNVETLVVGIAMIVVVGFAPGGIAQSLSRSASRLRGNRKAPSRESMP
ncbi:Branched-chain amino acid ABC transporter permease [Paraburkholderia unamae]|uniref:branched-chain amino acid ABC transporter permease n=1 Tax=Paraburkholderia unamae TaxID=219649 RepID=UPI001CAC9168|nr:branched-chain amino acid ABC transporter permease [Paraburkholderia unamae]CAG9251967.1 Branched-chain amino acid ABC transporter permease [Paraburkholderia unamae]